MMTREPPWPDAVMERLCAVLASTNWPGLSGTEIGRQLQIANIADPNPDFTKRNRLFNALVGRQNADQSSHRLVTFVVNVLAPARYIDDPLRFDALQQRTNEVLSMVGLR